MSANPLKEEIKEKENTAEATKQKEKSRKRKKKVRIRKFPIWLRIIVILILAVLSLMVGLMVGYGVIGEGNAVDALKVETWQHIIDIVQKEK